MYTLTYTHMKQLDFI